MHIVQGKSLNGLIGSVLIGGFWNDQVLPLLLTSRNAGLEKALRFGVGDGTAI